MTEYLSFEEVAIELKCTKNKVLQLVLEDRTILATRLTMNGTLIETSGPAALHPYDLDFCDHIDNNGLITTDIYKHKPNGEAILTTTLSAGHLRIERSILAAYLEFNLGYVKPSIAHEPVLETKCLANDASLQGTSAVLATSTLAPIADGKLGKPNKVKAVTNWKMQIQIEATEVCKSLRKSGANPSKASLAEPMAKWCRDNNIKTNGGIFPSPGYIKTSVLGGKHWELPN